MTKQQCKIVIDHEAIEAAQAAYYGPSPYRDRGLTHEEIFSRVAKAIQRFINQRNDAVDLILERDAALTASQEEIARLRALLERASDKLCHYIIDCPEHNTLDLINECDRATARK